MDRIFSSEKELAYLVKGLGGRLWLVGGAVRDQMLGKMAYDRDYLITGLPVGDVPLEKIVGSHFPVFLVTIGDSKCEVALARTEKKEGTGYHGFEFYAGPEVSIDEDLMRRDLTINAMAQDVLTGEIVDLFDGKHDLENKYLRHVSDSFKEDPLRVYRVARFASQLDGFCVPMVTLNMMESMRGQLPELKPERIWKELEKVLSSNTPSRFFEILKSTELLDVHFPEVDDLRVPDKHDGTAFNHTMTVMDHGREPMEVFGLLCHDLGKGLTPKDSHPSHYRHCKLGVLPISKLCDRLHVPNCFKDFGIKCSVEHMRLKKADEMRSGKFVKTVLDLDSFFDPVFEVSFVDSLYREGADRRREIMKFYYIKDQVRKVFEAADEITGYTLLSEGKEPGPKLGEALFQRRVSLFRSKH